MTTTIQHLDTTQLRCGDVVLNHGMRILLDQPRTVINHPDRDVVHFSGKVLNPDDVRDDQLLWSFLHTEEWDSNRNCWVRVYTGRYSIQGNQHARWTVESRCEACQAGDGPEARCTLHAAGYTPAAVTS